ncbi:MULTISPECIES: MerR family transcriptional regulator [Clostridium]|jgi:DNA-binding transcriptional MerR regulator|uniref:MerR family transcriptional regulator n=1 Tax=Clostridium butyricum TaxID=1492 RepID=A0A512TJZ2_CLOBU|nr:MULTISPECIES: MerR family transcriptional regulator [Clostridium]MBS5983195.1 MerR family transcriptional regulator [Clostridium butyricum]MDB2152125.1 MerR family transcriptional regulator [Clostridium butyricum]MDU1604119.1 MerR family transcriptional regulator [Clostridium sp.]NOW25033.1 DNA-binding transcriptional MerR regulator [Clostridium butyricum]GEQ20556.1 MerR family transcriptional regulator [Clostridium butyricum]
MKDKSNMQIKEFSALTGIKRENLRYYDQIGLLSPEFRGKNGYRYYTRSQLTTAYLIISLRELGIGIDEIKRYIDIRTPEEMFSLFSSQKQHILTEIKKLKRILEVMQLYVDMAEDAIKYKENSINIEYKKKEPIFLGPIISNDSLDEAAISFYNFAAENGIDIGYPLGAIINKKDIENKNPLYATQYYFKAMHDQNSYKPEGKYAVFYGRCAYGESDYLYEKLYKFIDKNNLRMCSDAYEEYPLNELSTKDENQYCVKIEIMVEDM